MLKPEKGGDHCSRSMLSGIALRDTDSVAVHPLVPSVETGLFGQITMLLWAVSPLSVEMGLLDMMPSVLVDLSA